MNTHSRLQYKTIACIGSIACDIAKIQTRRANDGRLEVTERSKFTPSLAPLASSRCPDLQTSISIAHIFIRTGSEHTTQFDLECTLELTEDLRARDGLARLIVLNDGRLLIDLLCEVRLLQSQFKTCC